MTCCKSAITLEMNDKSIPMMANKVRHESEYQGDILLLALTLVGFLA